MIFIRHRDKETNFLELLRQLQSLVRDDDPYLLLICSKFQRNPVFLKKLKCRHQDIKKRFINQLWTHQVQNPSTTMEECCIEEIKKQIKQN